MRFLDCDDLDVEKMQAYCKFIVDNKYSTTYNLI